jgi:hypothetical protein
MATSGNASGPFNERRPSYGPATSTPPRRPLSVRRTTTHDSLRPEGLLGPVVVSARGRDLRTGSSGQATVLETAHLDAEVEYLPNRTITRIAIDPPHPGVQELVGVRASTGFRQAVDDAMPGARESRSVRFQLLDDLPTALLVSGHALQASAAIVRRKGPMLQHPDMCAGWVTGGTLLAGMAEHGRPTPHRGPLAPVVDPSDDPLGWHHMDRLPPHGMRRRRRLDVWSEDELAVVECFFRDSHVDAEGIETVLHEYTVHATVVPATMRFVSCEADVGALPFPECPNAAASAGRLGGAPAEGLRRWVRDTFVGTTTCTHLNDTLRSLEDVGALLGALHQTDESMTP